MHLYEIAARRSNTLAIFAPNYGAAIEIYLAWWMTHMAGDLPDLEVKQRNPGWPGMHRQHLHEALRLGLAGIGIYEPEEGWTISHKVVEEGLS